MKVRDLVDDTAPVNHPGLLTGRLFPRSDMSRGQAAGTVFDRAVRAMATSVPAANARDGRLRALATSLALAGHPVATFTAVTATRLITGSGAGLPEVNVTALDPVYGTPFLPATGLKGATRAVAAMMATDPERVDRLFGGEADDEDAGEVCFLDGVPVATYAKLERDVTTSHHGGYYKGGTAWPERTEDPNPVHFLVVPAHTRFRFVLVGRLVDTPPDLVEEAGAWLKVALSDEGIGASTAAGYGYFDTD